MEQLIPIINKLQDVFGAIGHQGIDLPQIVVVGSQSSGKSSVLENIVGRDFLPRGTGIVTRRPLVLQLYSLSADRPKDDASKGDEWGEFLHLPNQRFYDFQDIRAEIQKETDRLTGSNKGISNISINLKIFSPHVLNLTLVDLPGITKVPTGDQPEDVEEQIKAMCMQFISNPNAIILAVTAANQDLANSDGLKLARSVDPDGNRTVGVLTKVDIMDPGTDCTDILANKVIPLKKGFVAVINRSQKDTQDGVSIRAGLSKELAFFQSSPKYRTMMPKCSTANLARTLNQILMLHIRDCLPEIKARIAKIMNGVQASIEALGDPNDSSATLGGTLLKLLSKFSQSFSGCLEGRTTSEVGAGTIETSELFGGARISYIFHDVFGRAIKAMDPFEGLDDEDIRTAIANANGTRPSLFVPEISFDLLVKRQIARLEQPGLHCADLVFDEMQRIAQQCETVDLARFPELRERIFETVQSMLRECLKPSQQMISSIISIELAHINTSHPDFIGGKQALAVITKKLAQPTPAVASAADGGTVGVTGASTRSVGADRTAVGDVAMQAQQGVLAAEPVTPSREASNHSHYSNGAEAGTGNQQVSGNTGFFNLFRQPVTPATSAAADIAGRSGRHVQINASTSSSTSGLAVPPLNSSSNSSSSVAKNRRRDSGVLTGQMSDKLRVTSNPTDYGRRETEIIKALIQSYFDIVRKTVMDLVPKTIMHFLVNGFKEQLLNELVGQLYRESEIRDIMRENDDVAAKRKSCKEMKDLLTRALEIVNEVRDHGSFR